MPPSMAKPEINMPSLPAEHVDFIQYVAGSTAPMQEILEPYRQHDTELRKVFAQQPDHAAVKQSHVVPVFAGHEEDLRVRARDVDAESAQQKECYIMPLKNEDRRRNGSSATVQSLQDFETNLRVFSESSLVDLDWSNVVVAGSAVVTSLLAVPDKHAGSKRALRQYYHNQLAPASDVDLFLYGLTEDQAVEKIKQIERNVRDALLVETTTIRTKNAITIASRHPVRHVQIVLRLYKSISEILTGFDVDCSCAAYDGHQVYASPRALVAYMTQINTCDLTRRSPSYENRLRKYAARGFEVHWPNLDRSRIDPTIFERSFGGTEGLARLLILEKLPKSEDRDSYLDQRRVERGRPAVNRWRMARRQVHGNIKDEHEDEVAEWVDEDVSNYHTFTVPYGPKFHARKIEKLLYTKDLLLNSEWNKPKDREVNLHRHPAFFGTVNDVIKDCCGHCPKPITVEEEEVAEEEAKTYVHGNITFMKDDPGRQAIGSFNPLTPDDWTTMAYVGNTTLLCQAIVEGDLEYVQSWVVKEGNDPNTRDHTGRTPLHLAVSNSTPEIVEALIDYGARIVARLVDGKTALHLAAMRGSVEIVSALLRKSEANEEEEAKRVDTRRAARKAAQQTTPGDMSMESADQEKCTADDSDVEMVEGADEDEDMDATTENSIINIRSDADKALIEGQDEEEPDIYDINVTAWDIAVSPLHLALVQGHVNVVKCLVQDFGADLLLPIKLFNDHDKSARAAILTLVLALQLPDEQADEMVRTLIQLGASCAQASIDQSTALQICVADRPDLFDTLADADATGIKRAINHLSVSGYKWSPQVSSPLMTAIKAKDSLTAFQLLRSGAKPQVDFTSYMKAYSTRHEPLSDTKQNKRDFQQNHEQPIVIAVRCELPLVAKALIEEYGVDPDTLTSDGYIAMNNGNFRRYTRGRSLLDTVEEKLEALEKWTYKSKEPVAPVLLEDDDRYLSGFDEGSYALWSAQKQLSSAKQSFEHDVKQYKKEVKDSKDRTGVLEKQDAVERMLERYRLLRDVLQNRGAKGFKDLHPDVQEPENRNDYSYQQQPEVVELFEVELRFQLGDLTDDSQKRYERLFEASWLGDTKTVKQLALVPWEDANGDPQPPCRIDVRDNHNLTPFALAVLRNHHKLATAIMEIAAAQHTSAEPAKQQQYGVNPGDTDDESDEEIQLYSEIIDDDFTVENVGEVSTQVKSRTTPLDLLEWYYPVAEFTKLSHKASADAGSSGFSYFGPRKSTTVAGRRTNTGSVKPPGSSEPTRGVPDPSNLIQLAIYNDDSELLRFLLDLVQHYYGVGKSEDALAASPSYVFDVSDLEYALRIGRTHLLSEIVARTGAGAPFDQLAKISGVELKEKPKYYQGLSVYGKKRKDWAEAGRNASGYAPVHIHRTPLLSAAYYGSLDAVEWFLSDAPMRKYKDFAEADANRNDKRLQRLSMSEIGFEGSVARFLDTRSHLAIHVCIMGDPTPESNQLLRYLIRRMPASVEAKSKDGLRPLQVAFELYREDAAKALIEAGADQTCRDSNGKNLIHSLLSRVFSKKEHVDALKRMLGVIDARLLPGMFLERATGSETPLHYWMTHGRYSSNETHENDVLKTLLSHSDGKDLNQISGEGNTPLHLGVAKLKNPDFIRIILEHDGALLHRENSTGRTPYEMAEDIAIACVCNEPPAMPDDLAFLQSRAMRYTLDSQWYQNVLDRSPKSFIPNPQGTPRSAREVVWELLKETKAKQDADDTTKRRLVTLNEANEVAKRLAAMKSRNATYNTADHEEEDASDEVQTLMGTAKSAME